MGYLGKLSCDSATPIRILHNSAAHLGGYARCLGAILMVYLGKLSHDNAKPIRILHNSAAHLGGYARCLGATHGIHG